MHIPHVGKKPLRSTGADMGKVASFAHICVGLVIWAVAISVELSWLALCFGTVVIGLLLLIFAPLVLIAPLAFIGTFANSFLFRGVDGLFGRNGALLRDRLKPPN
jgi:hypothetical protein